MLQALGRVVSVLHQRSVPDFKKWALGSYWDAIKGMDTFEADTRKTLSEFAERCEHGLRNPELYAKQPLFVMCKLFFVECDSGFTPAGLFKDLFLRTNGFDVTDRSIVTEHKYDDAFVVSFQPEEGRVAYVLAQRDIKPNDGVMLGVDILDCEVPTHAAFVGRHPTTVARQRLMAMLLREFPTGSWDELSMTFSQLCSMLETTEQPFSFEYAVFNNKLPRGLSEELWLKLFRCYFKSPSVVTDPKKAFWNGHVEDLCIKLDLPSPIAFKLVLLSNEPSDMYSPYLWIFKDPPEGGDIIKYWFARENTMREDFQPNDNWHTLQHVEDVPITAKRGIKRIPQRDRGK